jgi:predicted ABC-type sugar transport system permease subunit
MAKKKSSKTNRKHQFKYAAPSTATVTSGAKAVVSTGATSSSDERDYSYVGVDLRRIAWLGGALVIFQFALWYIFTHTGIGPSVYNLVQI